MRSLTLFAQALERAYYKKQSECLVDGDSSSCEVGEEDRSYMFSMAVAASLTEMEEGEQLALLRTKSLLKRLRRCEEKISEGRRWMAARKGLRDLGLS